MLINFVHTAADADHHRRALLADAANFRLAKLAKAARRARRAERSPMGTGSAPGADPSYRARQNPAQRNDDAERRCTVSP
ncbi:hypothetical protein [Pseudonocardia sp.]|jgi:hypothetical protein|uniref:hypothetical protein n=1 Tax=Pseudonocardia sp. TaxID=60912 RepID=UPI002DA522DC|nr:hypothetical protein [Pseudonocardia sp.]